MDENDSKSRRIPVNAWLYRGQDDALIECWENEKEKSTVIVRALERYYAVPESQRRDPSERLLAEIVALRMAVENLPQTIIKQLASVWGRMSFRRDGDEPEEELVSEDQLAKRRENRKKNKW